jgi:RimJ/RimL family protein N-acetyltransferase
VITLSRTTADETALISSCLNGQSERFLLQCGYDSRLFSAPVTDAQIRSFMQMRQDSYFFSIYYDSVFAGSCELVSACSGRKKTCTLMRFLISEQLRGKGIGTAALDSVSRYVFNVINADVLRLFVFEFNTSAVSCYKKSGFAVKEIYKRDDGNTILRMEKERCGKI